MRIDDQLHIDTPEGARLSLSLAGPLPRGLAYGIDLALRGLVLLILSIPLMLLGGHGYGLYLLLMFLLEWFYPVFFEMLWQGRTPGKRALKLAVVHGNGAPLTFNGSLVRNLLRTADLFPICYLTGFLVMLISPRQQRLGDLAADTLVIHLPAPPPAGARDPGAAEAPDWPLDREDQLVLLAFSERAPALSEQRRQELARLAFPEQPAPAALEKLRRVARHVLGEPAGQANGQPEEQQPGARP
ncbi:RDD family protein [Alloalcanivorax gelatiniphagus]|uniref:RDD family protein n=1 Tax=Alloalcanivorax gelatiniphagus TaxID=1194167 RepID=A0ABY2XNS3_9GAMM|nr:RDD family protein [Alloalcanivorax gelatiniphagus]TMW13166.1 RDD family protein [Alloalcanivorax gelatiniphagus]